MQSPPRPPGAGRVGGYAARFLPWLCLLLLVPLGRAGAQPGEDWKFDVVHLKNGHSLQGLLVEQSDREIRFRCVSRKLGSHTVVIPTTLQRGEVESLELLDAQEREALAARLKALDPTGKGEAERTASLELKPVHWPEGGKALRYESTHFVLVSNASEDIVRRGAVHLEQIFTAYARFLPPRQESGQPTTILLAKSEADYQALLKDQKRLLLNPAFYDPERNQIVCGTNLERLGEALEQMRRKNQQALQETKDREVELNKLFKGNVPASLLRPIQETRREIERTTRQNDEQFQEATRQLFRTLYHEAFHAYLANFVYPPKEADVPRWLNEGLAQIFETSFIEAGELRVGHADKVRLTRAQAALTSKDLVPLAQLLRSKPDQFVVFHASDKQVSQRYYLTSWAVAFYLTFDRRLLGTKAMDDYVHALEHGTPPEVAFQELVGQPLDQFEKDFRSYLLRLRPDGSVASRPSGD